MDYSKTDRPEDGCRTRPRKAQPQDFGPLGFRVFRVSKAYKVFRKIRVYAGHLGVVGQAIPTLSLSGLGPTKP